MCGQKAKLKYTGSDYKILICTDNLYRIKILY